MAQIAAATERIHFGPAVLIPSYRHPLAQASAIASIEMLAPGRLLCGFGTGFTGRSGVGKPPLKLSAMREHITQVRGLLRGEPVDIDGGAAQLLASPGWLPARPIDTPLLLASQGPKGRTLAREIADGLIALGRPEPGFEHCFVSGNGTVLDEGETIESERVREAVAPLVAAAYHSAWARGPEAVKRLPNGEAWLRSVEQVPEHIRHLSVHEGHNLDIRTPHDRLIDTNLALNTTFTGTVSLLRERVAGLEAAGATGIIFGTSGADVERELHAYARVAGIQPS
jgi:5,10-methylenetetrahydromethanopterin reductase